MVEYTYGPWIAHNGDQCPVPEDTLVLVHINGDGTPTSAPCTAGTWNWRQGAGRILVYQIATPKPEPVAGERVFFGTNSGGHSLFSDTPVSSDDCVRVTMKTLDGKLVSGMCTVEYVEVAQ